jgi:hypothetical protein
MTMSDDIRDLVRAMARLESEPAKLTAADVDVLGRVRDGLGVRAAICFELRRALNATKTRKTTKPSRRRAKR